MATVKTSRSVKKPSAKAPAKKTAAKKTTVKAPAVQRSVSKKAAAPKKTAAPKRAAKASKGDETCNFWYGVVISIAAALIFALFAYGIGEMIA